MRSRPIEDFYLAADGDDWSLALTRAQTAMGARDVMHITFQPRLYRFTSIDLFRLIHLQGAPGCGMKIVATTTQADDYQQTVFYLSTGGITIHYPTTSAGTGSYATEPTADSNRPSITDIAFIGPSATTGSTSFHCITAHRAFTLQNFSIYNFPGDGIHVHATASSGSSTSRGNANRCVIERGYIRRCGVNGIFFDGGDSNTSYCNTIDINDCAKNTSIATVTTSACTIVEDNIATSAATVTPTIGANTVTITVGAGHNYVTGFYGELVQTDNATVNEDTDGDGVADTVNAVQIWAAGQVTVVGNNITWDYTGSAPPLGTYKLRTGAGATTATGSDTTAGEGRVAWFTTSAATLAIGNTVTITGITQIPTAGGTVHRVYSSPANYTGVVCPVGTVDTSSPPVADPDLKGTLADGNGSLVPFAAQLYSSSFLPNLYENILFGPTRNSQYKLYDNSGKSTFLSCYSEGSTPTDHYIDGSSLVIGGNLPMPNTTQRGAAFLAGDGEGRLRVINGIEVHPEYFNNGWIIRHGLDSKYPASNKVFTVRHSDMNNLGNQPSFLGIEYDDSHSQQGGFLDWNNTGSAGSAIMLLPHAGNKRTKRFIAFPGGLQFGGAQDDNGYTNPGNPVRNPSVFGYLGFDRLGTGGGGGDYAVCLIGTGRAGIINSVTNNGGFFQITSGAADADFTSAQLGLRHIVTAVEGTTNANGHWIATSNGTNTTIDLSGAFSGTYTTYTATISTVDDSTLATQGYSTLTVTSASGSLSPGDRLSVGTADARKDLRVRSVSGTTITLYGSIAGATGTVLKSSGYVMQAQAMGWYTAAPTNGKWSRGDIIWNFAPLATGVIGWICTVGGESGGTWAPIAALSYTNGSNQAGVAFSGGKAITYAAAAPTDGTWAVGDIAYNTSPITNGIVGWSCTVAGTPGTWKAFTLDQPVTIDSTADLGTVKVLSRTFTAGGGGAPDDVTILDGTPGLPYAARVIDVQLFVTTAVGGSTCTLNTATGGGAAISSDMSSAAPAHVRDAGIASGAIASLAAGDDLYLRRSDSGVAGTVLVYLMMT